MQDGFLGYNTTFMLDFVVVSLLLIVPILVYSLWMVKRQRAYSLHRRLQVVLGAILLVAVGAFEIDLQVVHGGWENVVAKSYSDDALLAVRIQQSQPWLWLHLIFAVTTPIFWIITMVLALRRFSNPPHPDSHSALHKKLGWISAVDITMTAVTGLVFYYVAFIS